MIARTQHNKPKTMLGRSIISRIHNAKRDVIAEAFGIVDDLPERAAGHFIWAQGSAFLIANIHRARVPLEAPMFTGTFGDWPMAECGRCQIRHVLKDEISWLNLRNQPKILIDQIASWIIQRRTFAS
jgi:hypothetical protein